MGVQLGHWLSTTPDFGRQPVSADDIVVLVADILYDYLPPNSGVTPQQALQRIQGVVESPAGLSVTARHTHAEAAALVAEVADLIDQPGVDAEEKVSLLLDAVERPLAIEIYENEMERRKPRDAGRWH